MVPISYLAIGLLALYLGLRIHTSVRGFLPEDWPGEGRKRHGKPTPMIGMVPAGLCLVILFTYDLVFLGAAVLVAVITGSIDDYKKDRHFSEDADGLDWKWKALGLLVTSALCTWPLVQTHQLDWLASLMVAVQIFLLINATNFLDNTNGVACGVGGAGLLLASGGAGPIAMVAMTWLAVLPFNWPRSRVFLGDSGALALGTVLASTAVTSGFHAGSYDFTAALAPVFVFVVDLTQVLAARLYLGFAPWIGDRRHLTHIMMRYYIKPAWVAPILVSLAIGAWFALEAIPA